MNRPAAEVADILRAQGRQFLQRYRNRLGFQQLKVMRAIAKGHISAWDPVAQKEIWRVQHDGPWNGGMLSTAGNLLLQGTAKGEQVEAAEPGRIGETYRLPAWSLGKQLCPADWLRETLQVLEAVEQPEDSSGCAATVNSQANV